MVLEHQNCSKILKNQILKFRTSKGLIFEKRKRTFWTKFIPQIKCYVIYFEIKNHFDKR